MKNKPRSDKDRIKIYRGSADAKRRFALENKLKKQEFKSITEALQYAYDNPDKVDYGVMEDFITRNNHKFVWKDNDLELLKATNSIFINNPDVTPVDMKFIDSVLHNHIGRVVSNYMNELQNNGQHLTEFSLLKNYEAVRTINDMLRVTPGQMHWVFNENSRDKISGAECLRNLQTMMERSLPGIDRHYKDVLKYRYREDGTRQTFDEQMLNIAASKDYRIDDVFLRKMIKNDGTFLQGKGLSVLGDIARYRIMAQSGNDVYGKAQFIKDVYKDNIGDLLDSYEQQLSRGEGLEKKQLIEDYRVVSQMLESYSETKSEDMMLDGLGLGLYDSDKKTGKRPIDRLAEVKNTLEQEYGITSEVYLEDNGKGKKGLRGFYEQLKKVKADITGKKQVEKAEPSTQDKKQEMEYEE